MKPKRRVKTTESLIGFDLLGKPLLEGIQTWRRHHMHQKDWRTVAGAGIPMSEHLKGRILKYRWNADSLKIGREFLESFPKIDLNGFVVGLRSATYESPIVIAIRYKPDFKTFTIADAAVNFSKIPGYGKSALIDSITGSVNVRPKLSKFHREAKMPWTRFISQVLIKHAKKHGFKAVGLINPESLFWYHLPAVAGKENKAAVRKRMEDLYLKVAREMGLDIEHPVHTENAIYWMRKL